MVIFVFVDGAIVVVIGAIVVVIGAIVVVVVVVVVGTSSPKGKTNVQFIGGGRI